MSSLCRQNEAEASTATLEFKLKKGSCTGMPTCVSSTHYHNVILPVTHRSAVIHVTLRRHDASDSRAVFVSLLDRQSEEVMFNTGRVARRL